MRVFTSSLRAPWLLSVPLLLVPRFAAAQDTAETRAREAFERGVSELQAERFADALPDFLASYRLRAVPLVLYNIGLTYRGLHRNADALDAFTRYLAHPETGADPTQLAAVGHEVERLRAGTSQLIVRVEPSDAQTLVDGQAREDVAAGVWLDPGPHVVEARAAGFRDARADVTMTAGERRTLTLRGERYGASALAATLRLAETRGATEDRARRTQYGLIGAGAGVTIVGLGLAGLLQAVGYGLRDDYVARCVTGESAAPDGGCDALQASRSGQLNGLQAGTYIGLGLAVAGLGVALGGAITLARMGDGHAPAAEVRLSLAPGSIGLVARW